MLSLCRASYPINNPHQKDDEEKKMREREKRLSSKMLHTYNITHVTLACQIRQERLSMTRTIVQIKCNTKPNIRQKKNNNKRETNPWKPTDKKSVARCFCLVFVTCQNWCCDIWGRITKSEIEMNEEEKDSERERECVTSMMVTQMTIGDNKTNDGQTKKKWPWNKESNKKSRLTRDRFKGDRSKPQWIGHYRTSAYGELHYIIRYMC